MVRQCSLDELRGMGPGWVAWANLFARGHLIAATGKLALVHATRPIADTGKLSLVHATRPIADTGKLSLVHATRPIAATGKLALVHATRRSPSPSGLGTVLTAGRCRIR